MTITFATVKSRKSIRTYTDKPLAPDTGETLSSFLTSNKTGPFGTTIKFDIIDLISAGQDELKNLASYGNIKGPKYFMTGAIKDSPAAILDYGYLMEKNILVATALGLGTCWIGGTFSRAGFLEKINAGNDEIVPAVIALGYADKNRDPADIASRMYVSGDSRKPWKDIFFDVAPDKPLTEVSTGDFMAPLEALRLSPSAKNKQPWRVIMGARNSVQQPTSNGRPYFHIFLERTPGYWRAPLADLQLMDIGIAMCNFDVIAGEAGLKGAWKKQGDIKGREGWEYIATRE